MEEHEHSTSTTFITNDVLSRDPAGRMGLGPDSLLVHTPSLWPATELLQSCDVRVYHSSCA
jgi:hypothetical protein